MAGSAIGKRCAGHVDGTAETFCAPSLTPDDFIGAGQPSCGQYTGGQPGGVELGNADMLVFFA